MKMEFSAADVTCTLLGDPEAEYRVLQPVNSREADGPEAEFELLRTMLPEQRFCLVAVETENWFDVLSPWPSPAVIGGKSFAGSGAETLRRLETELLPALRQQYGGGGSTVLAGYSLAGLFALWAGYETDCFSGIAAASPSVWYPGWPDYAAGRIPRTGAVYLSLGEREEKTRNPVMSGVGAAVRAQERLLRAQNVPCVLEWNPGNHFQEPTKRMAKGIAWVLTELGKHGPVGEETLF